jgi:polyhydroxyalkanoate synthase subunit PhaC
VFTSIVRALAGRGAAAVAAQKSTLRRAQHLSHALGSARDTRVGSSPCEVVFAEGRRKLLRYRRDSPARYAEPVLFCYALINRHYILDLQPGKSVVERYLAQGFDVYMIDWGVPEYEDRLCTLENYVCDFLKDAVEVVRRVHGQQSLHLIGYCMGGTLSAIFTALYPQLVRSLTLLASPIDFAPRDSLLNVWSDRRYFDVDALVDTHGNCPAELLQVCFLFVKPVQNLIEKHLALFENVENPQFVANYHAVELWVNDNIPVAGEVFREFIKKLYQSNELVQGSLRVGSAPVELTRIVCPVLLLTANADHLVPPSSTQALAAHVGAHDVTSMTIDAGHVGLAVSSKAHRTLWPEATHWLAERSASVACAASCGE